MPITVKYINNTKKKYNSFEEIEDLQNVILLDCCFMNLKQLPLLPQNLQVLNCYNNKIEFLDNLPQNLQILRCYNNQIEKLDNLPQNLQKLYCYKNKLKNLDNLPQNLQGLYCSSNQIINLGNLPQNLQKLSCHYNKITSFNNSLLNCRNLREFEYFSNPVEFTPQQLNFINWIKQRNTQRNNVNYYNDTQNVHNSSLQRSLMKSIQNLLK
jgi:Leucine-rich repeat (LRR) protein